MTDRTSGLLVTLENSIREDDAKYIIDAISMIKGVLKVQMYVESVSCDIQKKFIMNQLKSNFMDKLFKTFDET